MRYLASLEAYSRRETLMKGGHQPFYHRVMIVVLSPRAWGKQRQGGLWLPVRYGGDATIYAEGCVFIRRACMMYYIRNHQPKPCIHLAIKYMLRASTSYPTYVCISCISGSSSVLSCLRVLSIPKHSRKGHHSHHPNPLHQQAYSAQVADY